MKKYVAYLRLSKENKYGKKAYGLEAQRQAINNVADGEIVKEFIEIETGTSKKARPILDEALLYCKENKCHLAVSTIDRLARNAYYLLKFKNELAEEKLEVLFADFPEADMLVIGIMALVAEKEAQLISGRIKRALVVAKERGKQVGSPQNLCNQWKGGVTMRVKAKRNENNRRAKAFIKLASGAGKSVSEITDELNQAGYKTARGCTFTPTQVYRLLKQ